MIAKLLSEEILGNETRSPRISVQVCNWSIKFSP
jgi:hypothetical protein